MRFLRKANRLDVKRNFVITSYIRKFGVAGRYETKPPTRTTFLAVLKKAKHAVGKLSERKLDKIVGDQKKKRLHAYNNSDWYLGVVSIKEIGVWKGAGGLPVSWTRGSVFETSKKVKVALGNNDKIIRKRSKRAIPGIIKFQDVVKKEKYLFPIIFKAGSGTNGREGLPKMSGDVDDGSMRSIALTISGAKKIKAYIGFPKGANNAKIKHT
jgi:hypothetical protein